MIAGVVAPFVGAWIEIFCFVSYFVSYIVAPFVGAWIEMSISASVNFCTLSLPSWERGLK